MWDRFINNKFSTTLRFLMAIAGFANLLLTTSNTYLFWASIGTASLMCISFILQGLRSYFRSPFSYWVAHRILARRYGYEFEEQRIRVEVSTDGAFTETRRIALRARSVVGEVQHYLHSVLSTDGDLGHVLLRKISPEAIQMECKEDTALEFSDRRVATVTFDPSIASGERAEYELVVKGRPKSIAVSREGIEALGLECEYVVWSITKPTKHLLLEVVIPRGLDIDDTGHDVWYDGGTRRQRNRTEWEASRGCVSISAPNAGATTIVRLEKRHPALGLLYAALWNYR
jgi:hypothetical protein